jgi:thiamine biosynthesis lipoprotein
MRTFAVALFALAALAQCGCAGRPRPLVLDGVSMGTTWQATLVVDDARRGEPWRERIVAELDRVQATMSHWDSDSELSRFNRAAPGTRHTFAPEAAAVLGCMLELAEASDGAFDPTVGTLANTWGFGPRGARASAPTDAEIDAALAVTGWRRIAFDPASSSALQPGGVELDFSAAAPGYALDLVAASLARHGLRDFLVELGGELRASGRRGDGQAWRVALRQPPGTSTPPDVLALSDAALGASGDYEHFIEFEGRRHPHALDARSGRPVQHGLAAVHVIADDGLHADALASLLSVLGPVAGRRHALAHDLAARLVTRTADGFETFDTPAFAAAVSASR